MEPAVVVALVGAAASLLVAGASATFTARTARRQATMQAERRDARSARRDYEYEARKRLYQECEPLIFQAMNLAQGARRRILSLARSARHGSIRADGSGWLAHDGYYLLSSCYLLVAPMSSFLLLQRRLTGFDLRLDRTIRLQYELLARIFASFSDDFDVARAADLPYRPDDADPGLPGRDGLLAEQPRVFRRQGLYEGTLSVVVEALLVPRGNGTRCMSFAEFVAARDGADPMFRTALETLTDLLGGFHPGAAPVLWRVLLAQLVLYDVLLQTGGPDAERHERDGTTLDPRALSDYLPETRWDESMPDADIRAELDVAYARYTEFLSRVSSI